MTLAALVGEFQTLIVGAVGFTGVITTLVINSRLARRQREEEWRHQRQAVRAALLAELQIVRDSMLKNTEDLKTQVGEPSKTATLEVPADFGSGVYRAFIGQIGDLSQQETGKIVNAYLHLQSFHDSLDLIGFRRSADARHISVRDTDRLKLAVLQESLIGPVEEAIGAMTLSSGEVRSD